MSFVHLHTHTVYSLLDGSNKIKNYIAKVKADGQNAAAITDHGVMYGCIYFYQEAKKQGINPIIGSEIYVSPGSRFDREPGDNDDKYYHLILLAENNTGYQNLMKIVSIGFAEGFYRKPRVDFETLQKYHEGLICLSACLAGQVPRLIEQGQYEEAKALALKYNELFGQNNYFLELQDHGIPLQSTVNQALLRIHNETGIPLVATNDCHYTNAEDAAAHDVLLCIQTKKTVNDTDRMQYPGGQFYVKTEAEMRERFAYIPEAIDNTQAIADRCHVDIEFGVTKLPHFDVPAPYDAEGYLRKLCEDGMKKRYPNATPEIHERLEHELSVIKNMGYVDYFLIVWDFIHFAKSHGIPVGPGRGSAAGSIVSYVTEITNIDPIKYDLLFERFLNPERVSMPDIDVDIADDRRGEVIEYVTEKYGADCVCQIVTFGTMAAKNAIRDCGRALDMPYSFVDSVAKEIPNRIPDMSVTIENSMKVNPHLQEMYESDEEVRKLIDTAKNLEGLPRHASMHAAGVIISEKPMVEYVPLSRVQAGGPLVTQYEKGTVEELGLLKMDFLGLRTLTVLSDAVKLVKKTHGIDIDLDNIDFSDEAMYKVISQGHTEGIFQLESPGMRNFMKELKPDCFEDIVAGISLYRPGPMDFIPKYLEGRRNKDKVKYDTPELEPILKNTYGCMVYQEQVMQIVRDLGGYSMGRSDLVRRAMAKKHQDEMQRERQNFVYGNPEENVPGCVARGISADVANKIYDEMIDFANYAFNKSHAAGYAVVALQTAYLRAHYPAEFFAAMMTSVIDRTPKVAEYIAVCRDLGIEILPPDVNRGEGPFTVEDEKVRFGLYAVKSVGRGVVDAVIDERNAHGQFRNLSDFFERVHGNEVTKRAIENFIKAGALDCFEGNRRQKLAVYQEIMGNVADRAKSSVAGQITLFDMADETAKKDFRTELPDIPDLDKDLRLSFEKEVLGIYISGHPLEDDKALMKKNCTASSLDFMLPEDSEGMERNADGSVNLESMNAATDDASDAVLLPKIKDGVFVTVGGMVIEKTMHFTKNNQAMAFVTIEDMTGQIEIIIFPKVFEQYRSILNEDEKLLIRGRSSVEENKDGKIIASDVVRFSEVPKDVWLNFKTMDSYKESEQKINSYIDNSENAKDRICIFISDGKLRKTMPGVLTLTDDKIKAIKDVFGEKNVFVTAERYGFR